MGNKESTVKVAAQNIPESFLNEHRLPSIPMNTNVECNSQVTKGRNEMNDKLQSDESAINPKNELPHIAIFQESFKSPEDVFSNPEDNDQLLLLIPEPTIEPSCIQFTTNYESKMNDDTDNNNIASSWCKSENEEIYQDSLYSVEDEFCNDDQKQFKCHFEARNTSDSNMCPEDKVSCLSRREGSAIIDDPDVIRDVSLHLKLGSEQLLEDKINFCMPVQTQQDPISVFSNNDNEVTSLHNNNKTDTDENCDSGIKHNTPSDEINISLEKDKKTSNDPKDLENITIEDFLQDKKGKSEQLSEDTISLCVSLPQKQDALDDENSKLKQPHNSVIFKYDDSDSDIKLNKILNETVMPLEGDTEILANDSKYMKDIPNEEVLQNARISKQLSEDKINLCIPVQKKEDSLSTFCKDHDEFQLYDSVTPKYEDFNLDIQNKRILHETIDQLERDKEILSNDSEDLENILIQECSQNAGKSEQLSEDTISLCVSLPQKQDALDDENSKLKQPHNSVIFKYDDSDSDIKLNKILNETVMPLEGDTEILANDSKYMEDIPIEEVLQNARSSLPLSLGKEDIQSLLSNTLPALWKDNDELQIQQSNLSAETYDCVDLYADLCKEGLAVEQKNILKEECDNSSDDNLLNPPSRMMVNSQLAMESVDLLSNNITELPKVALQSHVEEVLNLNENDPNSHWLSDDFMPQSLPVENDCISWTNEFCHSTEMFKDPAVFDFLLKGDSMVNIGLDQGRPSVIATFDPLFSGIDLSEKEIVPEKQPSQPLIELPNSDAESLLLPGDSTQTFQILNENLTDAEFHTILKCHKIESEESLAQVEKGLISHCVIMENDIANLLDREVSLTSVCNGMRDSMNANINFVISMFAKEKLQLIDATVSRKSLIVERDQALEDLRNVEKAFSDLLLRYDNAKVVLEQMKENELVLKQKIDATMEEIPKKQEKYDVLYSTGEEMLNRVNEDVMKYTKDHEAEKAALTAMLRKSEIKLRSLTTTLEQAVKDNTELVRMCEELEDKPTM